MERIRSNYALQAHRVTSARWGVTCSRNLQWAKIFLCHVATWTPHVATSNLAFFATSRRGFTRRDVKITCLCHVATWIYTSRRQNNMPLSRRDVDLPRRDVKISCLCHVATWDSNVATWMKSTLCHVATLPPTSRRRLV